MTSPEIRTWVEANIGRKLAEFGLPHWRVQLSFVRLDAHEDGFQPFMEVKRRPEYERAVIRIDADICAADYESLKELEDSVEHEIMHIVHSPFNLVRDVIWEMLTEDQRGTFNETWRYAEEMTLRNMERMAMCLRSTKEEKK